MQISINGRRERSKRSKSKPSILDIYRGATKPQKALLIYALVQMLALTMFQKVGLPASDKLLQLCLPTAVGGMAVLAYWVRPKVDKVRALLYGAFCFFAFVSTFFQPAGQSTTSFLLALLIYAPFVVFYEVPPRIFRVIVELFIGIMMVAGAIVLLQHLVQLTAGWRAWPNLDEMIPPGLLMPNFVYIQPITPDSQFMKPNGVFFAEVSILSQFLCLALVMEIVYLQRVVPTAFLIIALLLTFAGTGLFMLALTLPFLLTRFTRRTWILLAIAFVAALIVADQINWFDQMSGRFTEYQRQNTSANHRFIAPWKLLVDFLHRDDALYTGIGAGSILKADNVVWWPFTKVTVEYGLLTAISFYALFIYALFWRTPNWRVSICFFVFFSFMGGGFLVPIYPLLCMLFCANFREVVEHRPRRRRRSISSEGSGQDAGSHVSRSSSRSRRGVDGESLPVARSGSVEGAE
ncbi:hypothetical protein [Caulobacter sp.]|uniref:hypothetical protein n=1 Tax=Caulobacter sp. TaxID=78 RepID=UPI003BA93838